MIEWASRVARQVFLALALLIGVLALEVHAQTAGSVDTTFRATVTGGQNVVRAAVVQPDGKIVVAGGFTTVGTFFPTTTRNNIARLNADGSLDAGFNPGTGANGTVDCLAIQPDGKILAGGLFTTMNGQAASFLCRFNADGSLDSGFTTGIVGSEVLGIALQPDGKIIAVGGFGVVNGSSQTHITRLNADGALDPTFSPTVGANGQINCVALQPDGRIVIGGLFTTVNGAPTNRIARLTSTGLSDSSFNPGTGANSSVVSIALQPDGKILLGGSFATINGTSRSGIARLNSDGTLENATTFNPGTGPGGTINNLALQTDGKILCGGGFSTFNGSPRSNLVRLGSDGTLESAAAFSAGVSGTIYSIALQGDGKILLGGSFAVSFDNLVVRLLNSTATASLTTSNPTLAQWMRSGACGEISTATFELSTDNGNTWSSLGSGSRISGGWQWTGPSLPASGYLRARGYETTGAGDGAVSLIEQVVPFGGASQAPVANTLPAKLTASGTTSSVVDGAVLNASVNALGNSTTVTFQYGFSDSYGASVAATASPVSGSNFSAVSAPISNLIANFTYHYRVVAVSSTGTTYGNDLTFIALNQNATLTTLGVTGVSLTPPFNQFAGAGTYNAVLPTNATTATINFTLSDPNASASVNGIALPSGTTGAVVAVAPGNTTIPLVVTAQNGITQNTYPILLTVPTLPTAATGHPDVADTYAVLKASVDAMDTSASVTFQYGLDTNYGTTVAGPIIGSGFTQIRGLKVTGLLPGTTYHYQVTITNSQGTVTSNDGVFTTALTLPPGSIDDSFNPNVTTIQATAIQPDGRIVVGGFFGQVQGKAFNNIARLNRDGSFDTSFSAAADSIVNCVAVQSDGKILIGGSFFHVNGVAVKNFARLNPDGSLDTSFAVAVDDSVSSIAFQPDGKILIGGFFSTVGTTFQKYLARLNGDGSLDTSFAPSVDVWVESAALQDDGRIVIGGFFSKVNGVAQKGIARLNANGTTDSTFTATTNNAVDSVVVQPDGSVVLTGQFTAVNGITRNHAARVASDGTLDANFDPNTDGRVFTAALQTDGKVVIGGFFSNVGTTGRNNIARFNTDGTLDTAFDPDANAMVYSVAFQANGEVLAGGAFNTMFGEAHEGLALLESDPALQMLSVPDLTQIEWNRSGAGPEIAGVTFDLSNDGGATWNALGNGVRISGGWQLVGLSLPSSGLIRARGWARGGKQGGSSGILEQDFSYPLSDPVAPQISVQQPAGVVLTSGGSTVDFGALLPGANAAQTFTVFNTGNADLTNLAITIDGLNATDFVVTYAPASVLSAGESATFAVQFIPGAAGPRSAALHVASNAASNNPFNISLTGTGLTQLQNWRLTWFGTTSATGNAADTADFDGDGVPNLLEFAIGSDPTHATAAPGHITHNGSNLVFTYPRADGAMADGISFIVEWSDSLSSNSWSSVGVSETILSDNGTVQQVQATLPDGGRSQRFVRLRVTH